MTVCGEGGGVCACMRACVRVCVKHMKSVKNTLSSTDVFMSCERICVFWLGTAEVEELTKLHDFLETLQSSVGNDNNDDNDGEVRSHGNSKDIASDKFLHIFTVI